MDFIAHKQGPFNWELNLKDSEKYLRLSSQTLGIAHKFKKKLNMKINWNIENAKKFTLIIKKSKTTTTWNSLEVEGLVQSILRNAALFKYIPLEVQTTHQPCFIWVSSI